VNDDVAFTAWWVDEPVALLADDGLNRAVFVRQVLRVLARIAEEPSSTVIGLIGPWGSGKTSTINMAVGALPKSWAVARLTPWALPDADSLIRDLLASVGSALPASKGADRAREALRRYGTYMAPILSLLPLVGTAAKELGQAVSDRITSGLTLEASAERVAEQLTELRQPVLVIIDDVDRLQPDELLTLFRAVRVLGRFPYVHYLLAYDEETVLDVLRATPIASGREDRALAFLEKIVTLRLDQPPTPADSAERLLSDGLEEVLSDFSVALTGDERRRLADERQSLMADRLAEPRSIARLVAQLHTYLPLVDATEVDFADFVVLTFLRTSYPRMYRALAADARHLSETDGHRVLEMWQQPSNLVELGVPKGEAATVAAALHRLFPSHGEPTGAVRTDRRVSNPDSTHKYFSLTQRTEKLPDELVLLGLKEWTRDTSGEAARQLLSALRPEPGDREALASATRLVRRAQELTSTWSPNMTADLLLGLLQQMPFSPGHGVSVGPDDASVSWLSSLLESESPPPPVGLLRACERTPSEPSPLPALLRAMSMAPRDRPGLHSHAEPQSDVAAPRERWFRELESLAVSATWTRVLEHVALGDDAPSETVQSMIQWLEDVVGRSWVDDHFAEALGAGYRLPDLAARLVQTATDPADGAEVLLHPEGEGLLRRVGVRRGQGRTWWANLRAELVDGGGAIDANDLSWQSRRLIALDAMVTTLGLHLEHLLDFDARSSTGPMWSELSSTDLLRVPFGLGDNREPVILDLKPAEEGGMGPHVLVIGASGSGKTELLHTLVAALMWSGLSR
jgi:hypothetical protein